MQQREKYFIFFIIFLILGMLVTVQVRSTLYYGKQKSLNSYDTERLLTRLNEEKNSEQALKKSISDNEKKLNDYLQVPVDNNQEFAVKKQELDRLKLIACLADVKGPGLIITLNDAAKKQSDNAMDSIIHDRDVARLVMELRNVGAQAISINNERLLPTSDLVCAGPTIKINKNRYALPFEVKVVGDPEKMSAALNVSGMVQSMEENGKRIVISKVNEIMIPKYNNKIDDLISGLEDTENENR